MAERTRQAWAIIRRRSELFREGVDDETGDFEEYHDPVTNKHFWYYWRTGITRTDMPNCLLPQDADEIEAERAAEDARRKEVPQYKTLEDVRRAREEDGWRKQLKDARRKEERQKELARQKEIEAQKRLNRVVEKPYVVPRRRVAGEQAGADAAGGQWRPR